MNFTYIGKYTDFTFGKTYGSDLIKHSHTEKYRLRDDNCKERYFTLIDILSAGFIIENAGTTTEEKLLEMFMF